VQSARDRGEELKILTERIRSWLSSGIERDAIGVAARSASLVRQVNEALATAGLATTKPGAGATADKVRVGTMHGMKGLEFQAVAVVGVEDGQVPSPAAVTPADTDGVTHQQDLLRERCVLFVACTRARDHLHVSYAGKPSPFLPG
jgi:superfamily I DNA/RNA helicase